MYALGIDPGKDGGLALVNVSGFWPGEPICITAMPLTPDDWPDVRAILGLLVEQTQYDNVRELSTYLRVYVEKVNAMPPMGPGGKRRAGAQSSFNFGKGVGYLLGAFAALDIPTLEVTPQAWKKDVLSGTDHSKAEAAAWAFRQFPHLDKALRRPRGGPHLGKSEALCIATHGVGLLLRQKG